MVRRVLDEKGRTADAAAIEVKRRRMLSLLVTLRIQGFQSEGK